MTKQQLNLLGWLHLRLTVTYNIYIYTHTVDTLTLEQI